MGAFATPLLIPAPPPSLTRTTTRSSRWRHTQPNANNANPQSYTDPRTLITHVYATQLIDGLEVGDGNINVNIDRDGNVISVSRVTPPPP